MFVEILENQRSKLRVGLHGPVLVRGRIDQIRITEDWRFERIPGKQSIFQEIAQNGSGELSSRAMSPERQFPVFPLCEYMYA